MKNALRYFGIWLHMLFLRRLPLSPMYSEDGKTAYYLDSPKFYLDIEEDEPGVWSVYMRDRETGLDSLLIIPPPVVPLSPEMSEIRQLVMRIKDERADKDWQLMHLSISELISKFETTTYE